MDSCTEPPEKRFKLEKTFDSVIELLDKYMKDLMEKKILQAVLPEVFTQPLPLAKVICGNVKNQSEISRIISILNQKIPLKELQHLKRVLHKKTILLCPKHYLNGLSSIQEYLEVNVPELKDSFDYFKEIDVPAIQPMIKAQVNSQMWPLNFHPNKYYEKLASTEFFTSQEMVLHKNYMKIVFDVAKWNIERLAIDLSVDELLSTLNATLVVDPKTNFILAATFCSFTHPIQHSAMLAIDSVARTQKGGAWAASKEINTNYLLSGFDQELLQYLSSKYTTNVFKARCYVNKEEITDKADNTPYLCTGYYVYTLREPCVMCAMALVHARAKRVFFSFDNENNGALKSRTKLQGIESLNHHFEVFTGFL